MSKINQTLKICILGVSLAFATQATAHGLQTETQSLPTIAAGDSLELTISCPSKHAVISGGYENNQQRNSTGPLTVTASYPKSSNTWAVEVTNRSGRPTVSGESKVTLYAMCGGRRHR